MPTTLVESVRICAKVIIRQGAVYWLQNIRPADAEPSIRHPHVVIQDDALNQSAAVQTVVLCAITTNVRKLSVPGNVLLKAGEANLPRRSIVEVSKLVTVDKQQLAHYIGQLSEERVAQILSGRRFVDRSFFNNRHSKS